MQLNLFTPERLPHHPHCSDNLGSTQIRCVSNALRRRYIQPNAPVRRHWFVYDVDREGAAYAWDTVCAEPNYTVINPKNGHAHLLYALDTPIYLLGNARIAPIKYAAAVQEAYRQLLGADPGYQENLCKNPANSYWKLLKGPEWAYDLDELASYVPAKELRNAKRRKKTFKSGVGRNCTLFESLTFFAAQNINTGEYGSFQKWHEFIEIRAMHINSDFEPPLTWPEVKSTAKSVAKWVWQNLRGSQADYIARTHTSEIQAARGRKSGVVRRKGSITEQQPWVELGISRRTWFYRKKKGLL